MSQTQDHDNQIRQLIFEFLLRFYFYSTFSIFFLHDCQTNVRRMGYNKRNFSKLEKKNQKIIYYSKCFYPSLVMR